MDKKKLLSIPLFVLALSMFSTFGLAVDVNVFECGTLTGSGGGTVWKLQNNIINDGNTTCFTLATNNGANTLDCQNFKIDGAFTASSRGIFLQSDSIGTGFTIQNCEVTDYTTGIITANLGGTSGFTVDNVTIRNATNGLQIVNSPSALVRNSTFWNTTTNGINFQSSSNNGNVYNNFFNTSAGNPVGFSATSGTNLNRTRVGGVREFSQPNILGGNFYANFAGTGQSQSCADTDFDGFCDSSIDFGNSNIDQSAYSDGFVNDTQNPQFQNFENNPASPHTQLDNLAPLSVTFKANVTDDVGVQNVTLNINALQINASLSGGFYQATTNVSCNTLTPYNFTAYDIVNKVNTSASFTYNFTCVSTQPPVISGLVSNPSSPYSQVNTEDPIDVQFNATITDDFNAVDDVIFTIDGTPSTPSNSGSTYYTTKSLACGTHSYSWFANDTSGFNDTESGEFVHTCTRTLSSFPAGLMISIIGFLVGLGAIVRAVLLLKAGKLDITSAMMLFIVAIVAIVSASVIVATGSTTIE